MPSELASGAWNLDSPWSALSPAGRCALKGTLTERPSHSSHCPRSLLSGASCVCPAEHRGFPRITSFSLHHSRRGGF